jgi:hypothetical protein
MPKAPDDYSSRAVCDDPGKTMRAAAQKPAAHGFGVRSPEQEESGRMTVTSAERARCEPAVEDGGSVRWDYRPSSGGDTDPAEMTGLVLRVLGTVGAGRGEPGAQAHPGASLKGVVDRALAARGLKVGLVVYEDLDFDVRGPLKAAGMGSRVWGARRPVPGKVSKPPPRTAQPAQGERDSPVGPPPGAPGSGPGEADAAMDMLRATAIRTLRQHVRAGSRCALCACPWPCDPAPLAASALGAG